MTFHESPSSPRGVPHGASRSAWAMVVLSLVLLATPVPAAAQNLLANPNLDSNLNGWDSRGTIDSSAGLPDPGSARLQGEILDDKDEANPGSVYRRHRRGRRLLLRRPSPKFAPADRGRVHRHCD